MIFKKMFKLTCGSEYLIDHVPVKAVEHTLAMSMLIAKCWPQLSANKVVQGPSIFPQNQFDFSLPTSLKQNVYLVESFQRLFFARRGFRLYNDVRGIYVWWKNIAGFGLRLLLRNRQHIRQCLHRSRRLSDQHFLHTFSFLFDTTFLFFLFFSLRFLFSSSSSPTTAANYPFSHPITDTFCFLAYVKSTEVSIFICNRKNRKKIKFHHFSTHFFILFFSRQ